MVTLLDIIVFNIFLCAVATVSVRSLGIFCDLLLVGFSVASGELNTPLRRRPQIQSSVWDLTGYESHDLADACEQPAGSIQRLDTAAAA